MRKAIVEGSSSMDVSISKRMMSLFGLLCAGALMWVSALFCPNVALAQPAEASGSARIYILPFEYMDAILVESDGHFGMVDSGESSDSPDGSDSRYPVRSGTAVGQGVEGQVIAFMQSMGVNSENFDFYIGTHPYSEYQRVRCAWYARRCELYFLGHKGDGRWRHGVSFGRY